MQTLKQVIFRVAAIPVKVSKMSDGQKAPMMVDDMDIAAINSAPPPPPAVPSVVLPGPPPAMYPRAPHPPQGPYPPPLMPQPPSAYPNYHGYAMPHQAPTAPGQQPFFVPPY